MDRRQLQLRCAFAAASVAVALLHATGLLGDGVLLLAPVLLLAAPLILGRYIGEDHLARAITRPKRRALRAPRLVSPRAARSVLLMPRGGDLVAASLAVRPPPAAFALS